MKSIESGFNSAIDLIAFLLLLLALLMSFGFVYKLYFAKVANEHSNDYALVRSQYAEYDDFTKTTQLEEDRDYLIYQNGDYVYVEKDVRRNSSLPAEAATGEVSPGAAVFTEIQYLPNNISAVVIGTKILYNDVDHPDQPTVTNFIPIHGGFCGEHPNIAYYIKHGLIQELFAEANIDLSCLYYRSYEYADTYDYIQTICYTQATP